MGHRVDDRGGGLLLNASAAKQVAATLQALASPSRLLILSRLHHRPMTVSDLAEAVEMEQSAVSQQLRVLRNLGLVEGERQGRQIEYRLFDNHVAELIEQAIYHAEHVRLGVSDRSD